MAMEKITDEQRRKASIAAGLRSHRAMKKESQREFAKKIGSTASTVSAWETSGGISAADAWAAADHYGISIDELLGRKNLRII